VTDWDRYQQCPVCFAELGKPCRALSGFGPTGPISVVAERPHGGRKLRAASTWKGDA
jgi:hypothetical protein